MRNSNEESLVCDYFFSVVANEDEKGLHSCFLLPEKATFADLLYFFPYEGNFHFRLGIQPQPHALFWLDLLPHLHSQCILTNETAKYSSGSFKQNKIFIKVVQSDISIAPTQQAIKVPVSLLDFPSSSQKQQKWQHEKLFRSLKKSTVGRTLQAKSKQMWSSLLVTTKKAEQYMKKKHNPPSAEALMNLELLHKQFLTPVQKDNKETISLLYKLWFVIFNEDKALEPPRSLFNLPLWKSIGFTSDNPLQDLRTLLPLRCFAFMADVHPNTIFQILQEQTMDSNSNSNGYAFAIVGVNIVIALMEILSLERPNLQDREEVYWILFEDSIAFYELFSIAFHFFDKFWNENKPIYHRQQADTVREVINIVKDCVVSLLGKGPTSIETLVDIAHDMCPL